jgi:hypothetical protein
MACSLNSDQVANLYSYLYGEVADRMSGKNKNPLDVKSIMKDLYTFLTDPTGPEFETEEERKEKALYFVQAIPEVFQIITTRPDVRDYILKNNRDLFIEIPELASEYSDIKNVEKLVKPTIKTRKVVKQEIEDELQNTKRTPKETDGTIPYAKSEYDGKKVVYANGTSGQQAVRIDPDTGKPRNEKDPEKKMFYEVIKDIVYIARQNSEDTDEILYGEDEPVSLALTVMQVKNVDPTIFTQKDKEWQDTSTDKGGIIAIITDTEGNEVYFNEDGSINNEGGGRRVYQYIRTPILENGKLFLSGHKGKVSLVPAEQAAETILKEKKANGIIKRITPEMIAAEAVNIRLKQTETINGLLRLREKVKSSDEPVILQITDGSFGVSNEALAFTPISETGLNAEDLIFQPLPNGRIGFTVNVSRPGVSIDQMLYLQRPNISDSLAGHIADILTTRLKLDGKELNPQQRRVFFENYINNDYEEGEETSPDKINVKERVDEEGQAYLEVRINGEEPIPQNVLYTAKGRDIIYKHLLTAKSDPSISSRKFSAALNYNTDLINKKTFIDYVIDENNNKLIATEEDYFDFIKDKMLIQYPSETAAYFSGLNAYLNFSIPRDVITSETEIYELGEPAPKNEKEPNPKSTSTEPKAKVRNYTNYKTAKEAYNKGKGTWAMRPATNLDPVIPFGEHFGNPWSTQKDSLNKYVKVVDKVETAVKNYEDWLTGKKFKNIEQKRRKWILDAIAKGWLDDTTFIYYKPAGKSYRSHVDVLVDLINKRNQVEKADIVINEVITKPKPLTKTEKKEQEVKVTQSVASILQKRNNKNPYLERNVRLNSFLDRIFTTKKAKDNALNWWEGSFLSQVKVDGEAPISLTRLTEIANSDAVATFENAGITLYKGGTNIDIYHEAWHAFSQLFLTPEEQEDLYEEVKKVPKWANVEDYLDIEEDIAEDFRSLMKSEKFKESLPKFLRVLFERIAAFLRWAYGGLTRKDMTRPRDIPRVRQMFDVLRTNKPEEAIKKGLFQSLNASTKNVRFTKLNRGTRNIQPIKANKNDIEFTDQETLEIVNSMDALMALEFQDYNVYHNSTVGFLRTTKNETNRVTLYENIYNTFLDYQRVYIKEYNKVALANVNAEEVSADSAAEEVKLKNIVDLLSKVITNYGDPKLSLDKKQHTGVIAYHMQKSRFSMLRDSYNEIEDTTSIEAMKMLKDASGNILSSKQIASEETLMLLSGVFKVKRTKDGKIINDENGNPLYETDRFNIPMLETVDNMWNRLAKLLAGSYDINEMYQRILDNVENYPEFTQLMNLLPQLNYNEVEGGGYKTPLEYRTETNFWQDLKKPRIKYIQLNINKDDDNNFDAKISKASMDVYKITGEWESNFTLADPNVNKYIEKELGSDNNVLKINPKTGQFSIVERFGKKQFMSAKDSVEFLKALGIELDLSSPAIYNMVHNKKLNFAIEHGLDIMLTAIKSVNQSNNLLLKDEFRRNPLRMLAEGLPVELRMDKSKSLDVRTRIRVLAEIQNEFSDGYSNFSVLNSERNRVWEHFVDNTITRTITSINKAETYQELTESPYFKHMHWLAKKNNTMAEFSQLLNTVFFMKGVKPSMLGTKRKNAKLLLQNVTGTQFIDDNADNTTGSNTASMDGVSKFLQEYHTMLLNGVEEFMRHASKNMAMGLTVDKNTEINTYPGKQNKKLYIDIDAFERGGVGEFEGAKIMMGYLSGEANRIFRFKTDPKFKDYAGYNRLVTNKLGKDVMAGEAFTLFDDILKKETQKELYKIIDKAVDSNSTTFNMADILQNNIGLKDKIENDLNTYFNLLTQENLERLDENNYVDKKLLSEYYKKGVVDNLEDLTEMLTKAYTYNSFIHKYETIILAYGDLAQYNHTKEEFHKRNAGLGSGGKSFRADQLAMNFVNSKLAKEYIDYLNSTRPDKSKIIYRPYDGTFKTAIMKELKMTSKYYDEYLPELIKEYTTRYGDATKAKQLAEKVLKEYKDMKVADGQGYVTFEAYRNLKWLEGSWTDQQERLYKKISKGENISIEDAIQFFPPYKLQYFGNIESTGLPVTSFHKFSLAPLIPGAAKEGSELYNLHIRMMEQQVDYVTFETGSKVAHIGNGDNVFNEDGTFNKGVDFTVNTIYAEYLKNQTEINSSYKGVSIFSTQLRKMILEGLYENGQIKSRYNAKLVTERVKNYIDNVEFLTNIHKLELLNEIGYEEVDGEFIPTSNASTEKIANLIRTNLEKDDILSDDLISFIDVFEKDNTLVNDLSFHPESAKIEKLLLSIINKKIIIQKVKGEPLVQMSSAFFNDYAKVPSNLSAKTQKERDEIIKKYVGTNFLPTYHKKADGFTAAMKVMISMQGDYLKLFNLEYANDETIGVYFNDGSLDMNASLERLNEKIKDDNWLDANDKANRKAITMTGVRIPVQGLGQIDFIEVYHFLPPQASNIIIPPAEIVAKSGADFDIDKMTIYMKNLDEEGKVKKAEYSTYNDFKSAYNNMKSADSSIGEYEMFFAQQKAGIENDLIESMRGVLELPDNYASLITPNSNYILEDIASDLAKYVMKYDPYTNKMTEDNYDAKDKNKKVISPTRVLESLYNVYKHESNIVGKKTLGLGAIENTFNVLFNSIGAYMPNKYYHDKEKEFRNAHLWLNHHKLKVKGEEYISLSHMYDVNNEHKVADVISQMMNGWVDVEKDPWIFFIQGNYETAPTLLYLLKTGVPVKEAIYFVSNPLVIEYIKEKQLSNSTFAEILNKKPEYKSKLAEESAGRIIRKYFYPNELKMGSTVQERYEKGVELAEKYLDNRKDKHFSKEEMYNLIKNFKLNNGKMSQKEADLSKAMFLHFLEIEQQITGLTALKLSSNPDTATKSTGSEVELSEAGIDELANETKIPKEMLTKMLNDSVISSFFNGPLSLAVIRPLFKLRYNKYISDYIIQNSQIFRATSSKLLGERKIDTFITMFRNDLISMVFQNAIRKYKLKDSYMSYSIKREIPTALASEIKSRGAFVKANKDGTKFLYIDEKSLKEEFESEAWVRGSEEQNSYENRNMYSLDPRTFMENGKLNFELYLRFVAEREFLRSEYPIVDMVNKSWFRKEGLDLYEANPDVDGGTLGRFVYERYITNKALDNVYNFYHLFIDKENALAARYTKFLIEHKDSLLNPYEILNVLKYESNKNRSIFNLYLADKDMNRDKANLYTMNLRNLADRNVLKVTDKDENDRISDMFALMSNFAFLQTGLNKTKLNFTNVVDFTNFLDVMKSESEVFMKALEKDSENILKNFFEKFKIVNSRKNINKGRYKDYLMDYEAPAPEIIEDEETSPYELKETDRTNVFTYTDKLGDKEFYKTLVENNTDTVFIRNNVNETYTKPNKNFGGQQELDKFAGNMHMNITTSLTELGDNFQNLPKSAYKDVLRLWEEEIAHIQSINDGQSKLTKIAFPVTGFGDPALMPQELFVYLSKRLFDVFGYVNPGSVMYNQMNNKNITPEGLTDEEILEQLDLEENPFKCE